MIIFLQFRRGPYFYTLEVIRDPDFDKHSEIFYNYDTRLVIIF